MNINSVPSSYDIESSIKIDIYFLNKNNQTRYKSVNLKTASLILERKKIYKKECKTNPSFNNYYSEFHDLTNKLKDSKLIYRYFNFIKKKVDSRLNNDGFSRRLSSCEDENVSYLINGLSQNKDKDYEYKTKLHCLKERLLTQTMENEEIMQVLSENRWYHGSNSSTLPMLSYTNKKLTPTGKLLDCGIAPMCGELNRGIFENGVNQQALSVVTIEHVDTACFYALRVSKTFNSEQFDEPEVVFNKSLTKLSTLSPDESEWDPTLITLLQLKQWKPVEFTRLCGEYKEEIEVIKSKIINKESEFELQFLKALNFDLEKETFMTINKDTLDKFKKEFPLLRRLSFNHNSLGWFMFLKRLINNPEYTLGELHWRDTNYPALILLRILCLIAYEEEINKLLLEDPRKDEILKKIEGYTDSKEAKIPEVLRKIISPRIEAMLQKNRKPFEKRYQRFLKIFEQPPAVLLDEEDRKLIEKPFPIIFASQEKCLGYLRSDNNEYHVNKATLGQEISCMFVPNINQNQVKQWLAKNHIEGEVAVYDISILENTKSLPIGLIHSKDDILIKKSQTKSRDLILVNEWMNDIIVPAYSTNYPNGSKRKSHGVPHAVRTAFWSLLISELYFSVGKRLDLNPVHLIFAAGMHDCARRDDSVDLWDKESGDRCYEELKKLGLEYDQARFLGSCIEKKDERPAGSLCQKIIHDADCLEIIRCLYSSEHFDIKKLHIFDDLDPEITYNLVKEAKIFIELTESSFFKDFLERCDKPFEALFQLLMYCNKQYQEFNLLSLYTYSLASDTPILSSFNYQFTKDIEQSIENYFKCLKLNETG